MQVQILNKNIKLHLDSWLYLTIINRHTWKKLGKPTLLRSNKMAWSVTMETIQFAGELITNITFQGRTLKLKTFQLKNTTKISALTGWRNLSCGTFIFFPKIRKPDPQGKKFNKIFKTNFSGSFFLRALTAKFDLKDNTQPVFKKKMVPVTFLLLINEEHNRLEKTWVTLKMEYKQWTSPIVNLKKNAKEIRVCADFSRGLN